MKKISIKTGLILASLFLVFSSCIHNDFDVHYGPPVTTIPVGMVITLQDLISIYNSDSVNQTSYKFIDDFSVYGVITMDDKSGNLYKSAYVQDETTAINLHLLSSGGLYEGDSVRIYLKGLIIGDYAGMMQLDSVDVDDNIVKVSTLHHKTPEVVTLGMINTNQYLGKLVKIEDVQFVNEDLGLNYADDSLLVTENRTIEDEFGNTILVRTSGYASFAGNAIPEGRGSVIAIAGKYYDDHQLIIRNAGEVVFNERRFGDVDTLFFTNFDGIENGAAVNLTGWENYSEIGLPEWFGSNNGESATVKITGDENENTTWLILPQMTLASAKMQFRSRAGWLNGANLKLCVSTDYTGTGSAENAIWTELPPIMATSPSGSFGEWTESGIVDLSNYTGEVYVAFKYVTETGESGIFYLDDILVYSE